MEYVKQDDSSRKWMNEFRSKSYAKPISFEAVEGLLMLCRYHCFVYDYDYMILSVRNNSYMLFLSLFLLHMEVV